MKTLILTITLVVFTTFAFSQTSNVKEVKDCTLSDKVQFEIVKNAQDNFTLVIKNETGQKVCVKIKEENGSLVHQKNLRKAERNTIMYDISALPEGKYQFEIKCGKNMLYAKTLKKSEGTIAMTD